MTKTVKTVDKKPSDAPQRVLPELLAPAGGLPQLHAAVNNGADAVYLGGSRFNARAKADNFTLPQLRDAIGYAHERNVKIYVTFNTLLKDRELADALDYAAGLWDIGADAVIVQDMGLVRMLRKHLPDLPLHLSTQGTVTGKWAVDLMKDFGIRRIVPARELSIRELREMARVCHETKDGRPFCELEVFVHGALCMCYSGQCQMSRMLGASGKDRGPGRDGAKTGARAGVRSGNRGLCAQPCRLPYTDDRGRTGYYLSPKDLCLLEDLPALCEAGVDSLKIEGRLKSPEYVAVVTGIYRKYLDEYGRTGSLRIAPEDLRDLTQIYSRGGFTKGYLYGNPGERILSGASPKNTGILIGSVRGAVGPDAAGQNRAAAAGAAKKGAALVDVALWDALQEGDGVEFRPEKSGEAAGTGSEGGGVVTFRRSLPGGILRIGDMKGQIRAGDGVFRVTQRELSERAARTFDAEDPAELDRRMKRRIPLQMRFTARSGEPAVLEIREGERYSVQVRSAGPAEPALKKPMDPVRIRRQLSKLGGTPFEAAENDIEAELFDNCVVPVSEINRMRREGIDQLLREKRQIRREPADPAQIEGAMAELAEAAKEPVTIGGVPGEPERIKTATAEPAAAAKEHASIDGVPGKKPEARLVPLMEYMEMPPGEEGVLPYIDAVSKGRLDTYIEERFGEIAARLREAGCGILIRTGSWIRQFRDAGIKVYGGYGLNVYNRQAKMAWEEAGAQILELSLEAAKLGETDVPLMITEFPLKTKTLTDRKGAVHRVERSAAGDKTIIR